MKEKASNKTTSKTKKNNGPKKYTRSFVATLALLGTGALAAAAPFLLGFGTVVWAGAIALGLVGFSFGTFHVVKKLQNRLDNKKNKAKAEAKAETRVDSKTKEQEANKENTKQQSEKLNANNAKVAEPLNQNNFVEKSELRKEKELNFGAEYRIDKVSPKSFAVYENDGRSIKRDALGNLMVYRIVNDNKFYERVFDFIGSNTSGVCVFKVYDTDLSSTSYDVNSANYKDVMTSAMNEMMRIGRSESMTTREENSLVM